VGLFNQRRNHLVDGLVPDREEGDGGREEDCEDGGVNSGQAERVAR
jgi:hypothetical protein